jgi:hypothetical protein
MTDISDSFPPLNNAPHAGQVETFFSGQVTYLAPLPLPTDLPPQDYGHAVGEVNDTYLDFGVGLPAVFGWQAGLGIPISFFCMCTVLFPINSALLALIIGGTFDNALNVMTGPFPLLLKSGAAGAALVLAMHLFVRFNRLDKYHDILPTRFNRQRREVCFVPEGKTEPIVVPWESLSAWVVEARGITQYGANVRYAMGVGFYHAPENEHYSLEFHCCGFDLAVCNWEAIRAYMEYEVHSLKEIQDPLDLQNPDDPPHEGLHTFYNARERMRRRRKAGKVGFTYPFWWYLYHVMTLWTLPHHLTEWEIRRIKAIGRRVVPDAMQAWSAPLPAEQWAKPSEELTRMSASVKALHAQHPQMPLAQRFALAQAMEAERRAEADRRI